VSSSSAPTLFELAQPAGVFPTRASLRRASAQQSAVTQADGAAASNAGTPTSGAHELPDRSEPVSIADLVATAPPVAADAGGRQVTLEIGRLEDVAPASSTRTDLPDAADADLVRALLQVVAEGGSDLHITGNAGPTLRVDGRLRPVLGSAVWSREKVRAALYSVLTPDQAAAFEENLELDFAITVAGTARFRVNLYQQRGAIGGAFRLVPTEIRPLAELGLPEVIGKFAALPRGLVLVTGPTGSGKSTTLAALIDLVNRTRADHIVTVEDPIEFLHEHKKSLVNQREVGADTHSFSAALKHVLRQDPDVILIGELRDLETISVALTAAETGHLVFASLHTQDAAQSIDRIIDVFPPHQQAQVRSQLASTLQGVVCQMLLRRADGDGRVVATEVLVTTPAIANLIREGATHQIHSAMQAGRDLGMHSIDQRLARLVDTGTITHETALAKAQDADGLRLLIQRDLPVGTGSRLAVGGVDFDDAFSDVEPRR
jgi:twitching motility protein PilT